MRYFLGIDLPVETKKNITRQLKDFGRGVGFATQSRLDDTTPRVPCMHSRLQL